MKYTLTLIDCIVTPTHATCLSLARSISRALSRLCIHVHTLPTMRLCQLLAHYADVRVALVGVISLHSFLSQGRQVIPALGLAWTEQVNTRLLLQRHDRAAMAPSHNHASAAAGAAAEDASNVSRSISVTLASHLPASSCSFYVDAAGVHGVE